MSLELGEFFYQIRAALDCVAFEAATLQPGFNVAPHEEQLYFPLAGSPKKFKNSTFNKIPFPGELRDWVELIQPYNASKTDNTRLHGINKVFGVINDCARKDRHRRLHVVAGHAVELEGFVKAPPQARITYVEGISCNLLENESEFLRFGFEGTCTGDEIHVDGEITLNIAVQEIPVTGPGLDKFLSASQDAVQIVIERFHKFFPG
jgi:hypothetical protein